MDSLLPHLEPITTHLGFLEAPAARIAERFCAWEDSIFAGRGDPMTRAALALPLEETLRSLLPLNTQRPRRYLILETTGPWTAFLDSGAGGSDPAPLSQLALFLETRAVRAVMRSRAVPSQAGKKAFASGRTTIFELFGPKPSPILNGLRSVAAMHDGDR